jgi:HSP20 family protein
LLLFNLGALIQVWHTTCITLTTEDKKKETEKEENKMLVRYPGRKLATVTRPWDYFLNHWGFDLNDNDTVWQPKVDVAESDTEYEVAVEVPGLSKNDISISVEDGYLTISGERKQEEKTDKKNFHRIERYYGKFERSFQLPDEVKADEIKANYKNGVLKVEIPKTEKQLPKQIAIS